MTNYVSRNFDNKVYLGMAAYCVLFAILRISCSETLSPDEAEQLLNISEFSWGYINQAPLYSWILYFISKFIPINVTVLTLSKYLACFCFLLFFYKSARLVWHENIALAILLSLVLFITYAHNFHQDLTQSILVSTLASFCLYLVLLSLRGEQILRSFLLGVALALGMLAKYNFVFFAAPVFTGLLFTRPGRKMIWSRNFALTLITGLIVFLPHWLWELKHGAGLINHAVNKTSLSTTGFYSLDNFLRLTYSLVPSLIIPALTLAVVFYPYIRKKLTSNQFIIWGLLSLVFPLLVIFILKSEYFNIRWLCTCLFLYLLALWSLIDETRAHEKTFQTRLKIFSIICFMLIASSLLQRAVYNFFPNLTGRYIGIHLPAKHIAKHISNLAQGQSITLLGQNRHLIISVAQFLPKSQAIWLYPVSDDYYHPEGRTLDAKVELLKEQITREKPNNNNRIFLIEDCGKKRLEQLIEIYSKVFDSITKLIAVDAKSLYANKMHRVKIFELKYRN